MKNLRSWRELALMGVILIQSGCGQLTESSSSVDALVSEEQKQEAFAIIDQIDYIPYTFAEDGCYGRSLYMSMELAAAEIPSSSLYFFSRMNPKEGISWWYHVAPLIQTATDEEATILDPSLSDGPILLGDWIETTVPGRSQTFFLADGSDYANRVLGFGLDDYNRETLDTVPMLESFEEMNSFYMRDIASACRTMYRYLGYTDREDIAEARAKLIERTDALVERLDELDKLSGLSFFKAANYCTR